MEITTREQAIARRKEIRQEAREAKSDSVLIALQIESDELMAEFGTKCRKCGRKFFVLKCGLCFDCMENL